MKYLTLFETTTAYNAATLDLPNVSLIEENMSVGYNPYVLETRIVAKFNVTDTSNSTSIGYDGYTSGFSAIEIDGVEQPNVVSSHTFSTLGEHTVKYTLTDPTSIGQMAFYQCVNLTSIIIPNSVTSIGNSTFNRCSGLASIDIPNSVTSIGNGAFNRCSGLTSIDIPNSVTSIGNSAFYSCTSLTSCTIGSGVTSINYQTFYGCTSLTSIVIPNSVTSIGGAAFMNCTSLTSCTIGSGVTSINYQTFYGCTNLTSIVIPNSVTSIGNDAFYNTPWWNTYSADTSHHYGNIIYINDVAYNAVNTSITSVTFKSETVSIGGGAFSQCSGLTSIEIPSGVTSIDNNVFNRCNGLTSIVSNATTAPTIKSDTFFNIRTGGTLTVPSGSTGYDVWMGTGDFYLGKYNWTKVEQ